MSNNLPISYSSSSTYPFLLIPLLCTSLSFSPLLLPHLSSLSHSLSLLLLPPASPTSLPLPFLTHSFSLPPPPSHSPQPNYSPSHPLPSLIQYYSPPTHLLPSNAISTQRKVRLSANRNLRSVSGISDLSRSTLTYRLTNIYLNLHN